MTKRPIQVGQVVALTKSCHNEKRPWLVEHNLGKVLDILPNQVYVVRFDNSTNTDLCSDTSLVRPEESKPKSADKHESLLDKLYHKLGEKFSLSL